MKTVLCFLLCTVSCLAQVPVARRAPFFAQQPSAPAGFTPTAAGNFATSSSFLSHALPVAGANTATFTLATWLNPDAGYGSGRVLFQSGDWPIFNFIRSSGNLIVIIDNAGGAEILNVSVPNTADSGWIHFAISCDMTTSSSRQVYTNGVADTDPAIWITYSNSVIPWTYTGGGTIAVGAGWVGANYFPGCMGETWFNTNKVDLSADISKFISGGHAADPSSLGTPLIWLKDAASSWENNSGGSISAFTLNGPTLSSCSVP